MNPEYFTKDNLEKVLDNIVYNIIAANAVDEPAHVWMGVTEIENFMYQITNITYRRLEESLERLIEQDCITFDKNIGYRVSGFGGNFPPECIEQY